eukprot:978582-Pyramimonas_sp.AAC.1
MPGRAPNSALLTCVADTFDQVGSDTIQTYLCLRRASSEALLHGTSASATTLGSKLRKFSRLICSSNRDQSGSRGRAAGLPAGGGGGASPPCRRPRLTLTCGCRRWPSEQPAPLEAGCPAAGSAACSPTVMS